jgi:hypothetical protein
MFNYFTTLLFILQVVTIFENVNTQCGTKGWIESNGREYKSVPISPPGTYSQV